MDVHITESFRETRFTLNEPSVACQFIDGEAVLIHFLSGHYFSANGSGAAVLEAMLSGMTPEAAWQALAYPEGSVDLIDRFVECLLESDLIRPDESGFPAPMPGNLQRCAEPPLLTRHTDLEDLLLMDPIHEVFSDGSALVL